MGSRLIRESIYQMLKGWDANAERRTSNVEHRMQTAQSGHRRIFLFLCLLVFFSGFFATSGYAVVDLGIDVLAESNYAILKGKRVGLITNQTGVSRKGIRT